mmetsp:Transcript_25357/g.50519  ORF Transcript_25357/g.50519 Transcript_25357/m.50519 type:complete len:217 (-) Transcript_25357:56-706(-)
MQPDERIHKLRYHLVRNHLFQNGPLPYDARARLLHELGLAALLCGAGGGGSFGLGGLGGRHLRLHLRPDGSIGFRKRRGEAVGFDFRLQLIGGRLDGHPGAVKRKGHQHIFPLVAFVLRPEDRLGQAERVADVEKSVRIRIGKIDEEGLAAVRLGCRSVESTCFVPCGLNSTFGRQEGVAFCRALRRSGSSGRSCGGHCNSYRFLIYTSIVLCGRE